MTRSGRNPLSDTPLYCARVGTLFPEGEEFHGGRGRFATIGGGDTIVARRFVGRGCLGACKVVPSSWLFSASGELAKLLLLPSFRLATEG
jgi:hypothetical protein